LTVPGPGVLGNDTDIDSASLVATLVTGAANGTLTLNGNGSFVYIPAVGFSGADSFTYRASDGVPQSAVATVGLTVTPATLVPPVISAGFNSGQDGFTYYDNTFRSTSQSWYASGSRVATGGYTGGALRVLLGGINNLTVTGMSRGMAAHIHVDRAVVAGSLVPLQPGPGTRLRERRNQPGTRQRGRRTRRPVAA
jgi:hypothetical protein